jgi:hypothetical protein
MQSKLPFIARMNDEERKTFDDWRMMPACLRKEQDTGMYIFCVKVRCEQVTF